MGDTSKDDELGRLDYLDLLQRARQLERELASARPECCKGLAPESECACARKARPEGFVLVPVEPPFPRKWIAQGVRTVNGKNETKYLHWTDESGGWHQWSDGKQGAKHFDTEAAALSAARTCTGPWYNEPAKDTICAAQVENHKAVNYRAMLKAALSASPQTETTPNDDARTDYNNDNAGYREER